MARVYLPGSGVGPRRTSMKEEMAKKNGSRGAVYGVRPNKAYLNEMRFYKSSGKQPYQTGDMYQGEWVDDLREGYGTKTWSGGSKYEGEWRNDRRDGKGTVWVCESEGKGVKEGKQPAHHTHLHLRKQYAGDWKEGKRHGQGTFFYRDGGRYEGEWAANMRHGQGKMVYADGSVYEGAWAEGRRHGVGELRLPNGDVYEGHYLLDRKEGPGRFLYMSTRKMYEGEWVDDAPRCGEFKDLPEDLINLDVADEGFDLPILHVKKPGTLLSSATATIRNRRAVIFNQGGRIFSEAELNILQEQFDRHDETGEGLVRCGGVWQGGSSSGGGGSNSGVGNGDDGDGGDEIGEGEEAGTNGGAGGGAGGEDGTGGAGCGAGGSAGSGGSAFHALLCSVGVDMTNDEVGALLEDLQADVDASVSFPEFMDILSLLTSVG